MKIKPKSRKGLTLIELVIAIVAGVVLVLAAGVILFIGQIFWNQAWKKVNLQREASYAMLSMSRSIKAATSAVADPDSTAMTIYVGGNSMKFSLEPEINQLRCKIGDEPETVISDNVENVQFSVEGNKVTIDLELKEDDAQTHFTSTVMMRNYGG